MALVDNGFVYIYSVRQKSPPEGFLTFSQNGWDYVEQESLANANVKRATAVHV